MAALSSWDAREQSIAYSRQERRRWRESTLWGETPDEEAKDYAVKWAVPGRAKRTLLFFDEQHYEPVNLVANGVQYQPLDRVTNRRNPFVV